MAIDFNEPTNDTLVGTWATYIRDNISSLSKMNYTGGSNIPTDAIRWNATNNRFEKWNGSSWGVLSELFSFPRINLSGEPVDGYGVGNRTYNDARYANRDTNRAGYFVTAADGSPLVSSTGFDLEGITRDAFASVGPAGSGAANEWTALSSVSAAALWIEVRIVYYVGTVINANTYETISFYGRKYGSSASFGSNSTLINRNLMMAVSGSCWDMGVFTAKIPVESRIFDIGWSMTYTGSYYTNMYLTGYGIGSV